MNPLIDDYDQGMHCNVLYLAVVIPTLDYFRVAVILFEKTIVNRNGFSNDIEVSVYIKPE